MYNKLFSKIITSSIWLEPDPTRIIWITLLATMDQDGIATYASIANLAHTARIELEAAKEAIAGLEGPDEDSGDKDNEGRRIERIPGGWLVLNAEKYRRLVSREVVREQTRERVAKHRDRKKSGIVNVTGVTKCNIRVTPSEADSDSDATADKNSLIPDSDISLSHSVVRGEGRKKSVYKNDDRGRNYKANLSALTGKLTS